MAITRPILPPKSGYVEVEINGARTYKNIITGILIENEEPSIPTEERLDVNEEKIAALEDALCEADITNETRLAAIEDALCEMDMT